MLRSPRARVWSPRRIVAAASIASLLTTSASIGSAAPTRPVRDVGVDAGLSVDQRSYGAHAHDADGDGRKDLLLVHHAGPTELYRNTGDGFELHTTFVDELHGETDRHDCAWADVDLDGRQDLYCVKGARVGTAEKHNELWLQQPDGTFVDRAGAFRVVDRWGRGRRAAFLDLNGDPYPDLFVGNASPRQDGRPSSNRTFLNVGGQRFRRVNLGLTKEVGTFCVDVADIDDDGRDDLLVCEKAQLRLYLRRRQGFLDATRTLRIPARATVWAELADLDRDGELDLVAVTQRRLTIRLRQRPMRFGRPIVRRVLGRGAGLAIGNIDGRRGPDVLAVQGCVDGTNLDDMLLLNDGSGRRWRRHPVPGGVPGCGDVATTIDFDEDGAADFLVMNGGGQGQAAAPSGPDQLLTMGDWSP